MLKHFLITLVVLVAFFSLTAAHPADVCVHDIKTRGYEPFMPKISWLKRRRLNSLPTKWRPLNVQFDYSGLEGLDSPKKEFLINDLIPKVGKFLSSFVSTKYIPGEKWAFPSPLCHDARVSARYRQPVIEADLLIFVTVLNETNATYRAWASNCVLDPITGRPKAGQINFNWKTLNTSNPTAEFKAIFHTTAHELTHVLGLSKSMYKRYIDENGRLLGESNVLKSVKIRDFNTTIITLPKVRDFVRKYFNCPSAEGAELENQGGSGNKGSHWERRVFTNEFMTASHREDRKLSNLTLALLDSTGWYRVDYSPAGQLSFGHNAGCPFLTVPCFVKGQRQYKGWCENNITEGCDHKNTGKSSCSFRPWGGIYNNNNKSEPLPGAFNYFKGWLAHDHYCDNCPYPRPYSNGACSDVANHNEKGLGWLYDETYGPGSRCFEGNYYKERANVRNPNIPNHGTCHKFRCHTANGTTQVVIRIGKERITEVFCPPNGGPTTIPGYKGFVKCPNGEEFCKDEIVNNCPHLNYCGEIGHCYRNQCICPAGFNTKTCDVATVDCRTNKCSGRGICRKNQCECSAGWGGAECAEPRATTNCRMCGGGICYGGVCLDSLSHLSAFIQNSDVVVKASS